MVRDGLVFILRLPLHLFLVSFLEQNINYGMSNVGGIKMSIPETDFMYLEELIRKVDGYLMPQPSDNIDYLYSKDLRDRLYGKFPKCFIKIKGIGREFPTLLPICNRHGHKDSKVIDIARKVVQKIMADKAGMFDVNELTVILSKLDRMHSVYSKEIPKPPEQAGRKANVTRMMNKIKKHLDVYKGF